MKASGAEVVDVTIADFDSLLAGAGVINFETRFDLIDYLARTPGAPVASLGDILARGLFHGALENRYRRVDTVRTRDSEPYRQALAKQTLVRERIVALLDSLRLDAMAYPTLRRKPVLIGDAQQGSNCQLSAVSGLPALTAPAGYTEDGLPVGLELIGRPFADVRLVALAYAFEQSGPRRRAPPTTPALTGGRAPQPVAFTTTAAASPGIVRASFVYDPLRSELGYDVRVTGLAPDRIQAVVVRRPDTAAPGRVVLRLAGPGSVSATGKAPLTGRDREAFIEGRLLLSFFRTDQPAAVAESPMTVPRVRS
jgi:hypothetical protein